MDTSQCYKTGSYTRKYRPVREIAPKPQLPLPVSASFFPPLPFSIQYGSEHWNSFVLNVLSPVKLVLRLSPQYHGVERWWESSEAFDIQRGTSQGDWWILLGVGTDALQCPQLPPHCLLMNRLLLPTHPLSHLLFCPEWSSTWPSLRAQQTSCLFY